jgi:hypothetical protein
LKLEASANRNPSRSQSMENGKFASARGHPIKKMKIPKSGIW